MNDLDERLKRFEARNAPAVAEERERTRASRVVLFNMQELIFRTLAGAAFEACKRLEIDPTSAYGEIVPNHELKRMEVQFTFADDVTKLRCERDRPIGEVQRIFKEEFSSATKAMQPERERNEAATARFMAAAFEDVDDDDLKRVLAPFVKG